MDRINKLARHALDRIVHASIRYDNKMKILLGTGAANDFQK